MDMVDKGGDVVIYYSNIQIIVQRTNTMSQPRQRPIPVTREERAELDRRKEIYEQQTGDSGDWGKALGVLTLGGLAALGVYALVKAYQPTPTTWQVMCPNAECGAMFAVAITGSPPRLAQVACPYCRTEMVVDFGSNRMRLRPSVNGHAPLGPGSVVELHCHHCGQWIRLQFSSAVPQTAETFRCPLCGGVAQYGIGTVEV